MLSCGGGSGGGHLYNSSTDGYHNGGGAGGWNGSGSSNFLDSSDTAYITWGVNTTGNTSTNGTYSNLSSDSLFQVFPSFFQAIDHIDISMSVNGSQVEGLTGLTASAKKDVLPELHPDDVVNGTITIYLADGSTRTGRLASTTLSQNTRLVFIMEYRYLLKDSAGIYADIAGTYTSAAGINVSGVTWTKPNPAAAGTVLPIEKWQTNNGIPFAPGGIIRGVSGDIILTAIYGTGSLPVNTNTGSNTTIIENNPAPVSLNISGDDIVEAGSTLDLSAVITDVPAGVSVSYSWTSSDTAIATVTAGAANPATAVVTGVSEGSITITLQAALSDGRTVDATKDITVAAAGSIPVPEGMIYVAGGADSNGNTIPNLLVCDHEVTQGEYETYCGYGVNQPSDQYGLGTNYPAYYVGWYDALVYCNKRSMAENLTPCYTINGTTDPNTWPDKETGSNGKLRGPSPNNSTWNNVSVNASANGYRLPTSAEWEWAANGGVSPAPYTYAGSEDIGAVAWYGENSGDNGGTTNKKSHPVKGKAHNSANLYDMSGNVKEMCWENTSNLNFRVTRGGCWSYSAILCAVSYQDDSVNEAARSHTFGFRVVRNAP